MFDTKSKHRLQKLILPDYYLRVSLSLFEKDNLITPKYVRNVTDGIINDNDVWNKITDLIDEKEAAGFNVQILPLKSVKHIQSYLQDKNLKVADRYVRMVMAGERENSQILKAIIAVHRRYTSEVEYSQKIVQKIIKP